MPNATAVNATPSPLRILLAEDNVVNQKVALLMLERIGYQAQVVSNGLEVLDALRQQPFDVVLMDVQMPQMDGLAAAQHIKQEWPAEQCPRVIAMTASVLVQDGAAYQAAGLDGYLAKPIQAEELAALLRTCWPIAALPSPAAEPATPAIEHPAKPLVEDSSPPPETPEPRPAPLDLALLQSLQSSVGSQSPLALPLLIDCYLAEAPNLLQTIRHASSQADAISLRRAVHTLKSSSRSLGSTTLFNLCSELEELARLGTIDGVTSQLLPLEDEFKRFATALQVAASQMAALQQERH